MAHGIFIGGMVLGLCAVGPTFPDAALAQPVAASPQRAAPKVYLFNIPAQPLRSALLAYSNVVGNQIIYDSRLATNRRSQAVKGLFTAETALRMMIEGTNLTVLPTGSQDIMLAAVATVGAGETTTSAGDGAELTVVLDTLHVDVAPGVEDRPDFSAYAGRVRGRIKDALGRDPATQNRIYGARLELWVDGGGVVGRTKLIKSSGNDPLDAAIRRVLGEMRLDAPPKGMPLPIRIALIAI
ncbi:TonB C-terminal domain-containing protein [Sphingomonas sp. KR3-1]|uniref:TonB C-terminal domain-containing protein n=1 Tax=Sphingomonas sp. KR3-1 TaxID=3156611 RepID=UPI0032B40C36